ncbi:MAG: hypothetical protein HYU37_15450 [Acidobacteria bacterium]|nr:hypothetical protein [Acidobacteriota bacterium]
MFPNAGWIRLLVPAALSIVFAAAFCWPLLEHFGELGVASDWDEHQLYHWVPYETVRSYGQIPLWNPFECGGMPMLANPQSRWLSPFFLLHLWLGPARAMHIEIVAHIALAWLGAFVLGRVYGVSRLAAMAPAVVFAGCSSFYLHLGEGHTHWLPYAYMPWIVAATTVRRPFVAGMLLAVAIGEGGIYAVPHTLVVLGVLALHRSITERSTLPMIHLAVAALAAACLAAPKLLPMLNLLEDRPRLTQSAERMDLSLLGEALFARTQDLDADRGTRPYGFHEYGAYVSPVALAIAIAGVLRQRRASVPWVLVAAVALMLAFGHTLGGSYSPWALLHRLPIIDSQHVPSRFLLTTVLAFGMLAGRGVDALAPMLGRGTLAALLVTAAIDAGVVGTFNLGYAHERPVVDRPRAQTFVQFRDESNKTMYALARANMGALNCYEPLDPDTSAVGINEPHYRGEQLLLERGTVSLVEWTPNRLVFDVASDGPNVLVVNQNHDPLWRAASGRGEVMAHEGLLAVRVPAGSTRLVLVYQSTWFIAGVALALAALLVAGATALSRRLLTRSPLR